jgi:hypothetical protein
MQHCARNVLRMFIENFAYLFYYGSVPFDILIYLAYVMLLYK